MNVGELKSMLSGYENKELPVAATWGNGLYLDVTDATIKENGDALLLYENSYRGEDGTVFLPPVKTVREMLEILDNISDENVQIKAKGMNGELVPLDGCGCCCTDSDAMLNIYGGRMSVRQKIRNFIFKYSPIFMICYLSFTVIFIAILTFLFAHYNITYNTGLQIALAYVSPVIVLMFLAAFI